MSRGAKKQKFLHCPGKKGQKDKLKILPCDESGQDFDILPWDSLGRDGILTFCHGTGQDFADWDFDSLSHSLGAIL